MININSKQKDDDLQRFLGKPVYDIWIDGRRGHGNSVWEYKYESEKSGQYSKWANGEPNHSYSNNKVFVDVGADGKWHVVSDGWRYVTTLHERSGQSWFTIYVF